MNVRHKSTSWFAGLLVLALMVGMLPFNTTIHAAAEKVIGLQFESSINPVSVVVEGQSIQLKVLATIQKDSSTELRDVTGLAEWSSQNSTIATVDAGWVKGVGKGSVEVTAKYQGFVIKKTVTSEFLYDKIYVRNADSGQEVASELNVMLGMKPNWKVYAFDKGSSVENDVTADAAWSSSNTEVAEVSKGSIKLKAKGNADITVKHKGIEKKIKLTVGIPYDELKIAPNQLLEFTYGGTEQALVLTAKKPDGSVDVVTENAEWTTSDANIIEVKKGVVKPVNVGTASITASYLGRTASVTAVVRTSHLAMRMTPDKKQHAMLGDNPIQVKTFVLNNQGGQEEVTVDAEWTSSNVMTATVEKGLVSFKSAGTTTITASYKGLTKSVEITVYPSIQSIEWTEAVKPDANGIKERKEEIFVDESKPFPKVQGITFSGDKIDISEVVNWTSANPAIAKVDDDKLVGVSTGETQVTANVHGYTLTMKTVVNRKALLLRANTEELALVTGREVPSPTVTVVYTDGEEKDVSQEIKWESSSPNLLVREGKMKGLVASKVTLNGTFSNVKISLKGTIEEEIVAFEIAPEIVYLTANKSQSVKVIGKQRNGKSITLTSRIEWKSENEKVATVRGSSVKGIVIGSTKLVGEFQGNKLEVPVHVKPRLVKLEATPTSIKLTVGQSASWKVSAIYDTGEVVDVTPQATWVPSSTKVKVERGTVVGAAKGSASIKITFDGKSTSVRVSVK
ncbi:bacterial surface protein [Paenibacillus sp. UMB4589-SE434]|uniref:bacterial surface protein n=1 Tax=Paenibacillus sp. UMB4589-SE434 TaxID=3046314 RepID=UPI002551BACF|nr:bacterial surface protein [Paenibacillus sp. UMB4589-SE434]MDK8181992.1 bacterial surface protein [Paenibacillus sp. UMB4589-SE434]